ncbi:MAG: YARHG domain-containing protein, partial [Flavobacteriales bacterium]
MRRRLSEKAQAMLAQRDSALKAQVKNIVVTNNLEISDEDDLIGNWVGMFYPHDSLWSLPEYESMLMDESEDVAQSEKINLCIDSLNGDAVFGHTVLNGLSRPFSGTYYKGGNKYYFKVNEPGNHPYDGSFNFHIAEEDSVITGEWHSFNKVQIPAKQFELKKKIFAYDPDLALEEWSQYADYNKTRTEKHTDPEYGDWEQEQVAASTGEALLLNASNTLLTKEQVENMVKADLFVIRNSIYARHGYSFKYPALRYFFSSQSWYVPVQTDVRHELTDLEIQNIDLLLRYEQHAKEYYDHFGR